MRHGWIGAAIVGLLALAGCSVGGGSQSAAVGSASGGSNAIGADGGVSVALPVISSEVVKDQSRWTLPTDPYFGSRDLEMLWEYSFETVLVDCMHEAGFSKVTRTWIYGAPGPENLAENGMDIIFTEEFAAKYGYRQAPDPSDTDDESWRSGIDWRDDKSEEYLAQDEICRDQAIDAMVTDSERAAVEADLADPNRAVTAEEGPVPFEEASIGSQLNRLGVDTTAVPALVAAAGQWRECMAPLGIIDLPNEPWYFGPGGIPESLQAKWDWQSIVGNPVDDEIRVATADAKCRASSGWTDTLYAAEWDLREAFVTEHRQELEPELEEKREQAAHYMSIVEKYSGK